MNKLIDLTGQRFGSLVVIGYSPRKTEKRHEAHWLCQCICGNHVLARSDNLRKGRTTKCSECREVRGGRQSVFVKDVIEDGVV